MSPIAPAGLRYVVKVPHVQEVSLFGSAAPEFWREKLKPEGRAPAWSGEETWAGGILLPRRLSRTAKAEECFTARLSGPTKIYPFAPTDTLTISPTPRAPILQWLCDSGFTGAEWRVRADAVHAKSETYRFQ